MSRAALFAHICCAMQGVDYIDLYYLHRKAS